MATTDALKPPASSTPPRPTKRSSVAPWRRRRSLWCWLFLAPQVLVFLAFVAWPTVASWYFAFFDWDGLGPPTKFVGLGNFKEVAGDPQFWNSFTNSLIYTIALVVIVVPTSLIMALVLNSRAVAGRVVYRVALVLPVVLTSAVVGLQMKNIFATQGGVANNALQKLGVLDQPVAWLDLSTTAMAVVVLVGAWKTFGVKMIYWLAGIQTVPTELHEAATVDGASTVQRFRYITAPLLVPFLLVITFLQILDGLRVFDLVKTMTNGGPYFATDMVPLYIYRYAFEPSSVSNNSFALPRYGFASAAGIFYGLTTFIIALVMAGVIRLGRRRGGAS